MPPNPKYEVAAGKESKIDRVGKFCGRPKGVIDKGRPKNLTVLPPPHRNPDSCCSLEFSMYV